MVEQRPFKPWVVGPSPTALTRLRSLLVLRAANEACRGKVPPRRDEAGLNP